MKGGSGPRTLSKVKEEACRTCDGFGYYRLDVPYGHPDFARLVECTDCDTLAKRRLAALDGLSSLRGDLLRCGFNDFKETQGAREAYDSATGFAREPKGWLVLHGPNGSGKTHLAAAIALNLRAKGKPVLFMRVPDLLEFLRNAFDQQKLFVETLGESGTMSLLERLETVRRAPVLVLDDLAAESDSSWVREKLYQILDFRTVERLPTVVTLNLDPAEWPEKLGLRIADRLNNRLLCKVVYNRAASYRKPADATATEAS